MSFNPRVQIEDRELMQIGHILGRNLNILAFCYVLLESLDRRFIRDDRRFIRVL